MKKCSREFGCHSCTNTLMMLRAAIIQTLAEPTINHDRIKRELKSIKEFIEDIVGAGGKD